MASFNWIGRLDDEAIFAGEDIDLIFTVASTNITGWTLEFRVNGSAAGSAVVTDGPNGQLTVSLTAAQTTAIGVGDQSYRLWRTDSGSETVLAYGTMRISS